MSVVTLLSKAVLVAGGSIAVGATMHGLTAPVMLSDQPALVRIWGELTLVSERAGAGEQRATPGEARGFRLGKILAAPEYPDDEQTVGFSVGPARPLPEVATEEVGFSVGPARPAPGVDAEESAAPEERAPVEGRQRPEADELAAAIRTLRPAVQRCYDTGMVPGRIELTLTISGKTGRVLEASVSDESSTGRCLQQVGRTVRFAPFAQSRLTIRLPFSFR